MSDPLVYDYAGSIKSPDELGLDDNGTWHSVMRNLNGLEAYVKILTSGQRGNIGRVPNAAKTNGGDGGPMGNRYFMDTNGKCTTSNGRKEQLYSYVDNQPSSKFYPLRGLGSGVMSSMTNFDPRPILNVMTEPVHPDCRLVTLDTVDKFNNRQYKTRHVRDSEIETIDPCAFNNYKNPVTGESKKESYCESFTVLLKNDKYADVDDKNTITDNTPHRTLPDDILTNVYILSISCFGIFLMSKMLNKSKK